jgi:hypothetical protein
MPSEVLTSAAVRAGRAIGGFFSNAAFATWVQNVIIVISVIVAVLTLKDSDVNLRIANSTAFAQRYVLDKPSLSVYAADLRVAQFEAVQDAKRQISNFDQDRARADNWNGLFEIARPLVLNRIRSDSKLTSKYSDVANFFRSFIACVDSNVCDRDTAKKLLSSELLAFYNAVCPYIEYQEQTFNHEDESPQFLDFLVNSSGHTDAEEYFCRAKLGAFLAKK